MRCIDVLFTIISQVVIIASSYVCRLNGTSFAHFFLYWKRGLGLAPTHSRYIFKFTISGNEKNSQLCFMVRNSQLCVNAPLEIISMQAGLGSLYFLILTQRSVSWFVACDFCVQLFHSVSRCSNLHRAHVEYNLVVSRNLLF